MPPATTSPEKLTMVSGCGMLAVFRGCREQQAAIRTLRCEGMLIIKKRQSQPIAAVILAAGRNRNFTSAVARLALGRETVLTRLVRQLRAAGVGQIITVVGFEADAVRRRLPGVTIVENRDYATTLTARSLALGLRAARAPRVLCLDGDLVLDDSVIPAILAQTPPLIVMDTRKVLGWLDDKVRARDGRVLAVGKDVDQPSGESVGIMYVDRQTARPLARTRSRDYYEAVLNPLFRQARWSAFDIAGHDWHEIDFLGDYLDALVSFGGSAGKRQAAELRRAQVRQHLFCPGPVMVSERVKRASTRIEFGHREPEFSNLLAAVRKKLLRVAGDGAAHAAVIIHGSGSAANEAAISSLRPRRRILAVSNGEFGERLARCAGDHGHRVDHLRRPWGEALDPGELSRRLRRKRYDWLLMVHHETSTGTLNDIAGVARLAARSGCRMLVDCISSFGGVALPLAQIAIATGSANKCLAAMPGLAYVIIRKSARRELGVSPCRYLDLATHWRTQDEGQTLNTPPLSLYLALNTALDEVLGEGPRHCERIALAARHLRRALTALGFAVAPGGNSPLLTNFLVPDWTTFAAVHDFLKDNGFLIYPGKGELRGRIIQVANIGRISRRDIDEFVRTLRRFVSQHRPLR